MSQTTWMRLCAPIVGRFSSLFYPVAALVAEAGWRTRPATRRALLRNMLPLCGGNRERAIHEARLAYRNIGRYWLDVTTIPHRRMERFERDHIRLVDGERLKVLQEPGPVILVSAHMGGIELPLQAITHRGRPFVALVEEVSPPAFARYLYQLRSAAGGRYYPANFAGVRACYAALRRGEVVGVLADRDIQGSGLPVRLAGRWVRLPRGPWEMAQRTGALVLPVFAARDWRDRFTVYVEEPFRVGVESEDALSVHDAVTRFASLFERHLLREPGQWTVMEDFWRAHRCG